MRKDATAVPALALLAFSVGLAGCGSPPGVAVTNENTQPGTTTTDDQTTVSGGDQLSLKMAVDFIEGAAQQQAPTTQPDDGPYPLTRLTPTVYAAAFQRLSAIDHDGQAHDWFTSSTLAGSLVADFTTENRNRTLGDLPIALEQVQRLEMVVYYLQLRVPIGGQERTIRIYLSDDAVTGEGQHHQGDMTEVNESGVEVGWLTAPFFEISPVRTLAAGAQDAQGNPVSVDPVSGHQRGLFGDLQLWNVHHPEDAWLQKIPVAGSPLGAALANATAKELTIRFDVRGTWMFHDVNGDGQFAPAVDTPGPENHPDDPTFQQQTGWAPLLPRIFIDAPELNVNYELAG